MTISWHGVDCWFVVEEDISSQAINDQLLKKEINAEVTSAVAQGISTNYNENTGNNDGIITFDVEPSSADKTIVATAIADHEGTESTRDPSWYNQLSEESTTETDWDTVFVEETPPLMAGVWQLDLNLELKAAASSFSSGAVARLMAQKLGGAVNEHGQWASNIQLYDGKSIRITFTAEEADTWQFGIQLKQMGGTTAFVQRIRASLTYSGTNK